MVVHTHLQDVAQLSHQLNQPFICYELKKN